MHRSITADQPGPVQAKNHRQPLQHDLLKDLVERTLQTLEDTLAQATGETEGHTYAIA